LYKGRKQYFCISQKEKYSELKLLDGCQKKKRKKFRIKTSGWLKKYEIKPQKKK